MTVAVTLLTRAGCHLCDDAAAVLDRVLPDHGLGYATQDVDADPDLRAEYGERVPVVLLDGDEHAYFDVDEARLRAALTRRGAPPR